MKNKKRQYIKRDCSYWGHNKTYAGVAVDSVTGKTLGNYSRCRRCKYISVYHGVSEEALRDLIEMTLKDMPKIHV